MHSSNGSSSSGFYAAIVKTYEDFASNTSIHGLKYTVEKGASVFERLLWLTIVCAGIVGSAFMLNLFWVRYTNHPTRTNVHSYYVQISQAPFPTLTLCNDLIMMNSKVENLLAETDLKKYSKKEVKNALPELFKTGISVPNVTALEVLDEIFYRNGSTDVLALVKAISPTCDDLLVKCMWESEEFPCLERFTDTFTEHRLCCSFNSYSVKNGLMKLNPYLHTPYYDREMGLAVIIDPPIEDSFLYLKSLKMQLYAHITNERSVKIDRAKFLEVGTMDDLSIRTTIFKTNYDLRVLAPTKRGCTFRDEVKLDFFNYYSSYNCYNEHLMKKTIQKCGCYSFFYNIRPKGMTVCSNASLLPCILEVASQSLGQRCMEHCEYVTYNLVGSRTPLVMHNSSLDTFLSGINFSSNTIVLYAHYDSENQVMIRRKAITSTVYLLYSLGGIFSLFLGCSFVSLAEIFYYVFVRFPLNLKVFNKVEGDDGDVQPEKLFYPSDFKTIKIQESRGIGFKHNRKASFEY